jgi:hypothetical protein
VIPLKCVNNIIVLISHAQVLYFSTKCRKVTSQTLNCLGLTEEFFPFHICCWSSAYASAILPCIPNGFVGLSSCSYVLAEQWNKESYIILVTNHLVYKPWGEDELLRRDYTQDFDKYNSIYNIDTLTGTHSQYKDIDGVKIKNRMFSKKICYITSWCVFFGTAWNFTPIGSTCKSFLILTKKIFHQRGRIT